MIQSSAGLIMPGLDQTCYITVSNLFTQAKEHLHPIVWNWVVKNNAVMNLFAFTACSISV